MKKPLNILDVARQARVSPATVSRVLSGHPIVSEATRARVVAAVQELDFQPNLMAQGLRRGRGSTVALLVGDIEQGIYASLTKHIEAALESIGLDLLLYNLSHSQSRLEKFIERADSMRLHGIVVATTDALQTRRIKAALAHAAASGLPVFAIGNSLQACGVPSILHDDQAAIRRSVSYLLEKYGPRVAYLGRIKGSSSGTQRYQGYRAALADHGLRPDPLLVWDRSYRYLAGYEGVAGALSDGLAFRAIQTGSDELALGAIAALRERGLRIPEDVAIFGIGNMEWSAHLTPALSTHGGHLEKVADTIREMFQAFRMNQPVAPVTTFERPLIHRSSA